MDYWTKAMVEIRTSSALRGWVRVLDNDFGVRGRRVKSRNCALASDLVRAPNFTITLRIVGKSHHKYQVEHLLHQFCDSV